MDLRKLKPSTNYIDQRPTGILKLIDEARKLMELGAYGEDFWKEQNIARANLDAVREAPTIEQGARQAENYENREAVEQIARQLAPNADISELPVYTWDETPLPAKRVNWPTTLSPVPLPPGVKYPWKR